MNTRKLRGCIIHLTISFLVISLLQTQVISSALLDYPSDIRQGPYVDSVEYRIIQDADDQLIALGEGEVQCIQASINEAALLVIDDPDIDYFEVLEMGYLHITINCEKYPLNISAFRRAFAFAFDKEQVIGEIMNGYGIVHDSVIPSQNNWCAEDEFASNYYTAEPLIGNQLLDSAGFEIDNGTGYRLAPNGEAFSVEIDYSVNSPEIAGGIALIGVYALTSLHVDAIAQAVNFNEYITRLDVHDDYDMLVYGFSFQDLDVDWLAYEYWSEYADVPYQNPTNFRNATYDLWREQLLYGTSYEEVYEAAAEMQKILQYNVPRLVVCQREYAQPYRNDVYTGYIGDQSTGIIGQWTCRNIHQKTSEFGGHFAIALKEEPDSFNIFVTNSRYSRYMLDNMYSSLYKYGPNMEPISDLARNLIAETHSDNAEVPEGHIRFTINIIDNATWSDGVPLNATDVVFTFIYQSASGVYGNPAATELDDLVGLSIMSPTRLSLEFSTETYWHFSHFAFDYIIPEHIFTPAGGIGYSGWNTWNPIFDPEEPQVTSGPFLFDSFSPGENYTLIPNPDFYYLPAETHTTTTTTSTTSTVTTTTITTINSTTSTTSITNGTFSVLSTLAIGVSAGAAVVIVVCTVLIYRYRKVQNA